MRSLKLVYAQVQKHVAKMPRAYGWALLFVCASWFMLQLVPSSPTTRVLSIADVAVVNQAGETVTLGSVLAGRPAVINVWASWCPFCTKELPDLVHLQKEFGAQLVVIGVNRHETQKDAEAYLQSIGAQDGLLYVYDPFDFLYQAIGGYVMPETIFVTADGVVTRHVRGPLSPEDMRRHVTALITGGEFPHETNGKKHDVVGCTDTGQCLF